MGLEKIAIEERNVRGRTAVKSAEVPDDAAPKRIFRRANAAVTIVGRRFIAQFERFLMGARTFFLVKIPPPCLPDGIQSCASVNIAIFTDAKKKNAIENTLDGFVEFAAFKQVRPVVVADKVRGKVAA